MTSVVCPGCEHQFEFAGQPDGYVDMVCPKCRRGFKTLFAKVRAKRTKGNAKQDTRYFGFRVQHSGRDDFIEVNAEGAGDFELRSGDIAAFSYIGNKLSLVQNLNTIQYRVLKPFFNWSGTLMQIAGFAVLVIAIKWLWPIVSKWEIFNR